MLSLILEALQELVGNLTHCEAQCRTCPNLGCSPSKPSVLRVEMGIHMGASSLSVSESTRSRRVNSVLLVSTMTGPFRQSSNDIGGLEYRVGGPSPKGAQ